MKVLLTSAIVLACIVVLSCNKNSSGPNPGAGPNSLFPLTQGNTWYYQDSSFLPDSTSIIVSAAYPDTMTVTKNTYTDQYGTVYLEMNDYNGWFIGSYIAVDPSNDAIYEADSLGGMQAYTAFAVAQSDGQIIQQNGGQYNPNNIACPLTSTLYGFVTPVTIGPYNNCLTNILLTTDCNSVPLEQIDTYVQPGTGVVRIEDDEADSSSTGGVTLFKSYSQTLTSATIVK
jgi:hypothetical protein